MATAREMKVRHPNLSFIVLEKEKEICKNGVQMFPMPLSILTSGFFLIFYYLGTLGLCLSA